MNWTGFRDARQIIAGLDPKYFNYNRPRLKFFPSLTPSAEGCGCVMAHLIDRGRACDISAIPRYSPGFRQDAEQFTTLFGISSGEARFLYGIQFSCDEDAKYETMDRDFNGLAGQREALRRFDVIAERHGGWPVEKDAIDLAWEALQRSDAFVPKAEAPHGR